MTLPPEKIGDKGQRYLIRIKGYLGPGWHDAGYSNDHDGAVRLGEALLQAPSATEYEVVDRQKERG